MRHRFCFLILSASLAMLVSCAPGALQAERPLRDPIADVPEDRLLDETARVMAGLEIPDSSPLHAATLTPAYLKYRAQMDASWSGFLSENMESISRWRNDAIGDRYGPTVFYPFSGPDILHPLLFYPGARDILMFGLESPGGVPEAAKLAPAELCRQLAGLPVALDFTLQHAFFVTSDMMQKVGRNRFCGITGIMMFFLSRGGYRVVRAGPVSIDRDGKLLHGPAAGWTVKGVEIVFRKGGERRRLRYFQLDIGDASPKLGRFLAFCSTYPPFTTIIKSASYLMHNRDYSRIRAAVLERSESILQDDTGIPFRYLNNKKWKLSCYGRYHAPIPVFHNYLQRDLKEHCDKLSAGPLPFSYGYGYGYADMTYHLVRAERMVEAK
ncbi:MAG: hypothetical protein JXA20_09380 [Spirochaetes bacterium]|nr:hypothetical protein [Spirochaetota bacterium]